MKNFIQTPKQQSGMTLMVALITLIVLMLLGVGAMVASNTMFKLAGNLQFENEAKNRAESALNVAENLLIASGVSQSAAFHTAGQATSSQPYYDPSTTLNPLSSWPAAASSVANGQFIIQLLTNAPIPAGGSNTSSSCMGCPPVLPPSTYNLFRVTARGQFGRGATRYVESIVQIP